MYVKRLLAAATALVLAVSLTACGGGSDTADTPASAPIGDDYVLKVGETVGALCHAPLQVAMELGYLDEEGINWERVDFGSGDIQAALGAGTIDAGFGLIGKFIQPIENGLNMVVTAGMHTGCTKVLVKGDSGISTIAVLKGAAYVAAHPEETAQLQIDGEYVSGDPAANAEILKSYRFIPSVQGGYDALDNVARDLQTIGVLKAETDIDAMIARSFAYFDGVPDSYTLEGDTFTPVEN